MQKNKVDILFNNAGVLASDREIATTVQSHEIHIRVNYISLFFLT